MLLKNYTEDLFFVLKLFLVKIQSGGYKNWNNCSKTKKTEMRTTEMKTKKMVLYSCIHENKDGSRQKITKNKILVGLIKKEHKKKL